jgi:hypothetical protein
MASFLQYAQQQLASYPQYRPATIGKLSAIPPSNNWQAIRNTAQQQLASYLQYRPATIGKLSAIPPSNNWQPSCNPDIKLVKLARYPYNRSNICYKKTAALTISNVLYTSHIGTSNKGVTVYSGSGTFTFLDDLHRLQGVYIEKERFGLANLFREHFKCRH